MTEGEKFRKVMVGMACMEIPRRFSKVRLVLPRKAYDEQQKEYLAIKKLKTVFSTNVHAKRACREIMIMKAMNHKNVISLLDVFTPNKSYETFSEIYLVMPLMDSDLEHVLRHLNLEDEHIMFILYQILCGIQYIHSMGIIHRDLKPGNIGIMGNCKIKIMDFGLARRVNVEHQTRYVVTRWYRAPEIILNWGHCNETVDIWSIGCIFGEMLAGHVIFPGKSHVKQFYQILQFIGTPPLEFICKLSSTDRSLILSEGHHPGVNFEEYFYSASPEAIDLLRKMLMFDTDARITPTKALKHDYLSTYREFPVRLSSTKLESDFDLDHTMSVECYKRQLYDLITNR